jgi:transposase-like protein
MQQKTLTLLQFQSRFGSEKACQKHLFRLRWPQGFRCPRCHHGQVSFHSTRRLYQCQACGYQASLTAGTIFHKTRTPLTKWFWLIWLMGRQKSGISMLSLQRMLDIQSYKTVWTMGHKIRKAMGDRDAYYQLAGLIEMDDTYVGAPKPGKRGRGAATKAKVVVAVETPADKPRFGAMRMVPRVSSEEIQSLVLECLATEAVIKTDGWQAYSFLDASPQIRHEWLVPGSGKEAPKALPWVHTLIANIKGNIRGIYHGVSPKHLPRYLAEFCYRFNRRFWEPQMFNRMLHAYLNSTTITFSELRT